MASWRVLALLGAVTLSVLHGHRAGAGETPVLPPSRPNAADAVASAPDASARTEAAGPTGGRARFLPLIAAEAKARGLPPDVADAVARVESGYDPTVIGGVGERGLMQVMPATASMLGFRGSPEALADPETNIRLGVTYLAGAWKRAGGDLCRALMKYRAGHNEERMSALSVEYCRRAKSHLAALGSPLAAGALPAAEFGTLTPSLAAPGSPGRTVRVAGRLRRVVSVRTATTSRRFWAAHTARVRAIEARLPWRRGGIMAPG